MWTVAVPDTAGGLDSIVEKLEKIKKVDSVEVVDPFGRDYKLKRL
jgi:translation elongation factor EF-1beta